METRTLNFKDNTIQELTLDELKMTVKEKGFDGKPLMGMYHHNFIENAMEIVDKRNLDFTIEPIMAAQNRDKTRPGANTIDEQEQKYGVGSIQSHVLRRIFVRLIISTLEDEETNTALALSITQLGFQIALGPNVKICQNQCILGADKLMSTYANDARMPNPERMFEVLGEWIQNYQEEREREVQLINAMKQIDTDDVEVKKIIGDLTMKRVRKENPKVFTKEPTIPLNQGQIGKFTETYLVDKAQNPDKMFNSWDIYNLATNLYKPGQTDYPLILSSNSAMSEYLMSRYQLN